jgi:hypothetical protein
MKNPPWLKYSLVALCVLTAVFALTFLARSRLEPAWMVDPGFKHGLEDTILELRAKRAIQPPAGYIHQEEVTWAKHEDGSGANLQDGRVMQLGKGNADYWTAINWEPGTKLMLYYSESEGVLLVEPTHGTIFPVVIIYGVHPLDNYQEELEKHVSTTVDTIALSNDMHRLWGLEADRCVREVLENPHAPQWVKENLVRLTHARKSFDDAYNRHVGACLEAFYGGGTMRSWDHSGIAKDEDRRFAQQLLNVRYQARFFKPPENPEEGK